MVEGTHSELSGSAGDVVQARDVSGGIHFHGVERSERRVPRQLPGDVRGFVNRAAELAKLDEILDDPGAVTIWVITGTAGVGKTALALRWAHRVRERYPDGQLYVNLRGYDPGSPVTPEYALDHFLRALNVDSGAIPADLDAKASMYRSLVADKRMLIALDNAATVSQVRPLLPGGAMCLVLVTSRSGLPGLAVRDGARRMSVPTLTDGESVDLLRVVTSGYREDDPDELAELARLCARLPLALRIAAERASGRPRMPLSELIQDLRDESSLWDALSTENDEEADAVRTVFAWSYRALAQDAARIFRLLGLHPGPQFSLAAAAALAGRPPNQVRHLLDALIGANLLEQTGSDSYQFHDLLRAYAIDQAHREESKEDQNAAVHRVRTWYLHAAAAARPSIVPGGFAFPIDLEPLAPDVVPQTAFTDYDHAVRWYEAERANLISAASSGRDRIAWQIPAVLSRVYLNSDPVGTWLDAQQIALAASRDTGDRYGEAIILDSLGIGDKLRHRLTEAAEHHQAALDIFRELGDRFGEAKSLHGLAAVSLYERQFETGLDRLEQTVAIARTIENRSLIGIALTAAGNVCLELGRLDEAVRHLLEAVPMLRAQGDHADELSTLRVLGAAQREAGQLTAARDSLDQGLALARTRNDLLREGMLLIELGLLEIAEDKPADALVCSQRAATIMRQLGRVAVEAKALDLTGVAYRMLDRLDDAAAFHRRAIAIQRDLDDPWRLAVALDNLAVALEDAGEPDAAHDARREATVLRDRIGDA